MGDSVFSICCIGCGDVSTRGHGPALKRYKELNAGVELAACCDIDESKAIVYQEKFDFNKCYTEMSAMLDNEKPDAVCLIVPVNMTAKLSIEIMKKGYPLIMEKPPGMNRDETLKIIQAARKYNVYNQVAFNRRYMPVVSRLKNYLDEYFKPHEIQNIQCHFFRVNRKDTDFSTTAIHGIDTVKFLSGSEYRKVIFEYQNIKNLPAYVSNIYMQCEFESGATAQLSFCPVAGIDLERIVINTYNHSFFASLPTGKLPDMTGRLIHVISNKVADDLTYEYTPNEDHSFIRNGFYNENASFFDSIRSGKKPAGDISSGLQSVEIADCIRHRLPEY